MDEPTLPDGPPHVPTLLDLDLVYADPAGRAAFDDLFVPGRGPFRRGSLASPFLCMFCGQPRTGPGACERCGPMLATVLTDPAALPSEIHKVSAWVEIPRELLCAAIGHVCDETCPPPPPRFVPSRRQRFGVWRRRQVWRVRRLAGLRIAHRDRIDQDRDD